MDRESVTFLFEQNKCILHDSSKGTKASPQTISLSKNTFIKGRRVFVMFNMFYAILSNFNGRFLLKFEDENTLYCFRDGVFISIAKSTGCSPELPLVLSSLDGLEETLLNVDSFYSVTTAGITKSRCRIGKAEFEFAFNHYSRVGGIHWKKKNFAHFDLNPLHVEGALYREQEEQFEMCGIAVPLKLVKLVSYAMLFKRENDRFLSALDVTNPFIYPASVSTSNDLSNSVCNISKVKWIFHKEESGVSISDYIKTIPLDDADNVDDWNMLHRVIFTFTSSSIATYPRFSKYELLKKFNDSHLTVIEKNEFADEPVMEVDTFEARISFIASKKNQSVDILSDTEYTESTDSRDACKDDENLTRLEQDDKNAKISDKIVINAEEDQKIANLVTTRKLDQDKDESHKIKDNPVPDNDITPVTENSTEKDKNGMTEDSPEQSEVNDEIVDDLAKDSKKSIAEDQFEQENVETADNILQDVDDLIAEDSAKQDKRVKIEAGCNLVQDEKTDGEAEDSLEQDKYYGPDKMAKQDEMTNPETEDIMLSDNDDDLVTGNSSEQDDEKVETEDDVVNSEGDEIETGDSLEQSERNISVIESSPEQNSEENSKNKSSQETTDISDTKDEYPDEWNDDGWDNSKMNIQTAQLDSLNERELIYCINDIKKQISDIKEIIANLGPEQEADKLQWMKELDELYIELQLWQRRKRHLEEQSKLPKWAQNFSPLSTIDETDELMI